MAHEHYERHEVATDEGRGFPVGCLIALLLLVAALALIFTVCAIDDEDAEVIERLITATPEPTATPSPVPR